MIRIGFRIEAGPSADRAGYAKSLNGCKLEYHSSHPEAETALLN